MTLSEKHVLYILQNYDIILNILIYSSEKPYFIHLFRQNRGICQILNVPVHDATNSLQFAAVHSCVRLGPILTFQMSHLSHLTCFSSRLLTVSESRLNFV